MATLSQGQVMAYAQSAGLSQSAAKIAAAIAMAESGGRTTAHNDTPPDNSYGLWQINMLGSMGPARRAQYGISSNSALYDPAVNARAMAKLSNNGSSWGAWSTYTKGDYKKYLDGSTAVPAGWWDSFGKGFGEGLVPGGDGGGGLLGDGLSAIPDALRGLTTLARLWLGAAKWAGNPHNWIRVAQVGGGAALVVVGVNMTVRGALFKAAQPLVSAAADVAPGGGVAKRAVKGGAGKAAKGAAKKTAAAKPAPKTEAAA